MRLITGKWTQAIGTAGVVFVMSAGAVISGARVSAQAAAGSSVSGGAYTDEQAKRGEAVSGKRCTSCHGPDLSGGEAGPALVGLEFLGNWNNLTAGDFYDRVNSTMPADAPGTLTPQETSDVMAYVFKLNKFPAGTTELPIDLAALKGIKIESGPAAK
ncbi:MAG TPA: cytochrome c [Vicinamibacterales bacterium]